MSIGIVIRRASSISLDEWRSFVSSDSSLRLRSEPYLARNPSAGKLITFPHGEADAEILSEEVWVPFLRWQRGRLTTEFNSSFEVPSNPIRIRLVQVAKHFGAVLETDASDEALDW